MVVHKYINGGGGSDRARVVIPELNVHSKNTLSHSIIDSLCRMEMVVKVVKVVIVENEEEENDDNIY